MTVNFTTWKGITDGQTYGIPDSGNLQNDYNATSFDLNDGDSITSDWVDSEGDDDATVQGSPIYREDEIGGEPAVELDGVDEYFDTGIKADTDGEQSLYIVLKQESSTSDTERPWGATSNYTSMDQDNGRFISRFGGDTHPGGPTPTTDEFVILSFFGNDGDTTTYEDDGEVLSGAGSGSGEQDYSSFIGALNSGGDDTSHFTGKIARVLRYDVEHDSEMRGDVWDNLNDIYGVF